MKALTFLFFLFAFLPFGLAQKASSKVETYKGLRFNFQHRLFLEADFAKPIRGQFMMSSHQTLDQSLKSQTPVPEYKECSLDPVIPLESSLYHLSFLGEKNQFDLFQSDSLLTVKIKLKLQKDSLKKMPGFAMKSKIMALFIVKPSDDCGLAAERLPSVFNEKTFEISATCAFPKCKMANPTYEKGSQGEFSLMLGFTEDDFNDAEAEAKASPP